MKLPAPPMSTVPVPEKRSRMKPSPPARPCRRPENAMSKLTVDSAATKASFSASQAREPSSSSARISPGSTPANAKTSVWLPLLVKYWNARLSPASFRLPASTAVRISPDSMPPAPSPGAPVGGFDSLVSGVNPDVQKRNFPASQKAVCPGASRHMAICIALPTRSRSKLTASTSLFGLETDYKWRRPSLGSAHRQKQSDDRRPRRGRRRRHRECHRHHRLPPDDARADADANVDANVHATVGTNVGQLQEPPASSPHWRSRAAHQ